MTCKFLSRSVVGSASRQLITCARQQHLGDDPGPSCLVGRPYSPGGVTIEVLAPKPRAHYSNRNHNRGSGHGDHADVILLAEALCGCGHLRRREPIL